MSSSQSHISLDKLEKMLPLMNWAIQGTTQYFKFNDFTQKALEKHFIKDFNKAQLGLKGIPCYIDPNVKDLEIRAYNSDNCLIYTVNI